MRFVKPVNIGKDSDWDSLTGYIKGERVINEPDNVHVIPVGPSYEYKTIEAAVDYVKKHAFNAPVKLNLEPGTYAPAGQILIGDLNVSGRNDVVPKLYISSMTNNYTDVIIDLKNIGSSLFYVVSGSFGLTNVTVTDTGSYQNKIKFAIYAIDSTIFLFNDIAAKDIYCFLHLDNSYMHGNSLKDVYIDNVYMPFDVTTSSVMYVNLLNLYANGPGKTYNVSDWSSAVNYNARLFNVYHNSTVLFSSYMTADPVNISVNNYGYFYIGSHAASSYFNFRSYKTSLNINFDTFLLFSTISENSQCTFYFLENNETTTPSNLTINADTLGSCSKNSSLTFYFNTHTTNPEINVNKVYYSSAGSMMDFITTANVNGVNLHVDPPATAAGVFEAVYNAVIRFSVEGDVNIYSDSTTGYLFKAEESGKIYADSYKIYNYSQIDVTNLPGSRIMDSVGSVVTYNSNAEPVTGPGSGPFDGPPFDGPPFDGPIDS